MPTEVEKQEIINVKSETESVSISVNIRDGLVMKILFEVTDPDKGITRFLFPHGNTFDTLADFRAQIGSVISEAQKAISDV